MAGGRHSMTPMFNLADMTTYNEDRLVECKYCRRLLVFEPEKNCPGCGANLELPRGRTAKHVRLTEDARERLLKHGLACEMAFWGKR